MEEKFSFILSSNTEQINGEEAKLQKWKDIFDSSTKKAKECLENLSQIVKNQIEKIGEVTEELLPKFEEEIKLLQKLRHHQKDFQHKGLTLLENVAHEEDFIAKAESFLSTAKLPNSEGEWRLQYFIPRVLQEMGSDHEQKKVIGYFHAAEVDEKTDQQSPEAKIKGFNRRGSDSSLESSSSESSMASLPQTYSTKLEGLQDTDGKEVTVDLLDSTNKSPSGTNLKVFHDALFTRDSMWISGWTKNRFTANETLLAEVQNPHYAVKEKAKREDPNAHVPTMMLLKEDRIIFSKKRGNEIWKFSTKSKNFALKYNIAESCIGAICSSKDYLFILDQKAPEFIRKLDFKFNPIGSIPTGIKGQQESELDICRVASPDQSELTAKTHGDIIVISKAGPDGFIRALNRNGDVEWEIEEKKEQSLGSKFNPYSVTASTTGFILVADHSSSKV